jgi:hypothetical protein
MRNGAYFKAALGKIGWRYLVVGATVLTEFPGHRFHVIILSQEKTGHALHWRVRFSPRWGHGLLRLQAFEFSLHLRVFAGEFLNSCLIDTLDLIFASFLLGLNF